MAKDYYVYVHRRKSDGRVFYVGKGQGRRANDVRHRSKYWNRIVEKHGLVVDIVHHFSHEPDAFSLERELIAFYGRGNLCNLTDGGEGPSGIKRSEATKKLMSERSTMSLPENRLKISLAKKGKKRKDLSEYPLHHRPGVREKVSGANNHKARAVICLDNGMRFDTATAASMWLRSIGYPKASNGDIVKCCKGKAYKSHKHRFAYA
jgi:hypothetical protein